MGSRGINGILLLVAAAVVAGALSGCANLGSGSAGTYTVSGTVTGLSGTTVLKLNGGTVNGSSTVTVSKNGAFSYSVSVSDPNTFSIAVQSTPGVQAGEVTSQGARAGSSFSGIAVAFHDLYFFAASNTAGLELWKSDGTSGGTASLGSLTTNTSTPNDSLDRRAVAGGYVYLAEGPGSSNQLWKSDGSTSSEVAIANASSSGPAPIRLTALDDRVYFSGSDSSGNIVLWSSDGTTGGSYRVQDSSGDYFSGPASLVVSGSSLYFDASLVDSSTNSAISNSEGLWKLDGTTGQVSELVSFATLGTDHSSTYVCDRMTVAGDLLFFSTAPDISSNTDELWSFDLSQAQGSSNPTNIASFSSISSDAFYAMGTTLYFGADDGSTGTELWKSDGTAGGTTQVSDINSGSSGSSPWYLTAIGGELYFAADDGSGYELWKSDGTSAGTAKITTNLATPSDPGYLSAVGSILIFGAYDSSHGYEPWALDTTKPIGANNPYLIKDIYSGSGDSMSAPLYGQPSIG